MISEVRNGCLTGEEREEILNKLKSEEGIKIYEERIHFLVPWYRVMKNVDEINSFLMLRNKAQLYWDNSIIELFNELKKYIDQIRKHSRSLYNDTSGKEPNQSSLETIGSNWTGWNGNKKDDISEKIEDIVAEFRDNLEEVYKDRRTPWKKRERKAK